MSDNYRPKAFISCSLRSEDKWFVDWVEAVILRMGFQPFGTVGRYSFSPEPLWKQIRDNIRQSDCVVIAATPRYVQQDIHDRRRTEKGLSEMLHVEVGMAVASDRPVLAFVLPGTDVGAFLPQLVQYIKIDPSDNLDILQKWPCIANYFRSALTIILEHRRREETKGLWKSIGGILAVIGGAHVIDSILSADDSEGDNA